MNRISLTDLEEAEAGVLARFSNSSASAIAPRKRLSGSVFHR
jgi:hypothetical protein